MATVNSRPFIDRLMAGNGRLPEDQEDAPDNPRAVRIVEYRNFEGVTCWGVVFENEARHRWDRYEIETAYVQAPRVIWTLPDHLRREHHT